MPRKKQGLRSYHHKSRNGCMQCKRRHVKCTMQTPACANCVRRNETCEYPRFLDSNPLFQQQVWALNEPVSIPGLPGPSGQNSHQIWQTPLAVPTSGTVESNTTPGDTSSLLLGLSSCSVFSPREKAIWFPSLSKAMTKYPYLQHCVLALANLHDPYVPPVLAYQHQVTASSLFRQSPPRVDEDNWLAVLSFGTLNLMFQFHSQNSCPDSQFDLIGTLRVVRSTTDIQRAAEPFFHRSELGKFILSWIAIRDTQLDIELSNALEGLAHVLSDAAENGYNDDDEASAEINRQAFWELREWAYSCQGLPRWWEQFCQWPSKVMPEYLDLLADGNDVALLIFIYWAAIMHGVRKPVVGSWAKRAAFHAVDHLQEAWGEQLVWPLQAFSVSPSRDASPLVSGPLISKHAESVVSGPLPTSTVNFVMPSTLGLADNFGEELAPFIHTTSA